MKRQMLTPTLIALSFIIIGFSAHPALAYRGGYYEPYYNFSPYFSLSGGAWLPAHTTSLDATLKPTEAHYDGGFGISDTSNDNKSGNDLAGSSIMAGVRVRF